MQMSQDKELPRLC